MKTRKITLNGKSIMVPCNNSNEISDSETKLSADVIKYIKAAPRLSRSSNGKPRFKDDAGQVITIGCKTCCQDGEVLVDRKGSNFTKEFWEDIQAHATGISEESQAIIEKELATFQTKESMADEIAKLRAELAKLQKKSK